MLIIDSDRGFAEQLADLFRDSFKVNVYHYRPSIDEICAEKLDIIIINQDMSDNAGIELFAELKSIPALTDIPVVFLSDSDDPATEEAALNLGATDYLSLSVDSNVLRARINNYLLMRRRIERLSFLTTIDPVTRLANRRLFNEYLAREWARAVRQQQHISVLAVELAGLDDVAESYGDALSERCLSHMARVIERCLQRPGDFPARYMDNKILVILPETDAAGAELVLKKIADNLEDSIPDMLSKSALQSLSIRTGCETIKPDRTSSSSTCIRSAITQLKMPRPVAGSEVAGAGHH